MTVESRANTALLRLAAVGAAVAIAIIVFFVARHRGGESEVPVATDVPVHVARTARVTLRRHVEGFGTVTAEPAQTVSPAASARVASPTTGVVAKTLCSEGLRVKKDDVLFELDARAAVADERKALAAKQVEDAKIARAVADAEFAKAESERTHKLFDEGIASDKEVHAAELAMKTTARQVVEAKAIAFDAAKALDAARARLSLLTIRAPLDGTIVRVSVSAGEAVDLTTVLAEIVDLDRLIVEAQIPAVELPLLRIGQAASLTAAARSSQGANPAGDAAADDTKGFVGMVSFIGLAVERKTDSVQVRVSLGKGASLRPGQYVRLTIAVAEHAGVLAVPTKSVVSSGGKSTIFVVEGDHAASKLVTVGLSEDALTEVAGAGVSEGMVVVTEGAYGLPDGTRIKIVEGP